MKTSTIRQTATFPAEPQDVYELIMDARKHTAFSGSKVTMSKKEDGKFSLFDGYCHGYNISLKEGKEIVQAWHFDEDGWPADHFSICTFRFERKGKQTKMTFIQHGVPQHKTESLKRGWKEFYWGPMKTFLQRKG